MAAGATFLDPIEERAWRSRDNVSVCVANNIFVPTIATASVNVSAQQLNAAARARPPVRLLGWPNPRTVSTFAARCTSLACRPGAQRIPVMAAASPAGRPRYKMP